MLLTKNYSRVATLSSYTGWITPEGKFLRSIGYQRHNATLRFHNIPMDIDEVLNHGFVWLSQEYTSPDEISVQVAKSNFPFAKQEIEKLTGNDEGVERILFEFVNKKGDTVDELTMQFDYTHTSLLRRRF